MGRTQEKIELNRERQARYRARQRGEDVPLRPPGRPKGPRLAERVARALFVSGSGEEADRLVLTVDGPPKRDLGGWTLDAAAAVIDRAMSGGKG